VPHAIQRPESPAPPVADGPAPQPRWIGLALLLLPAGSALTGAYALIGLALSAASLVILLTYAYRERGKHPAPKPLAGDTARERLQDLCRRAGGLGDVLIIIATGVTALGLILILRSELVGGCVLTAIGTAALAWLLVAQLRRTPGSPD
jgi:hypothetical protein